MHLALRAPDLISAIISVDNSPNKTKLSERFPAYIKSMQEIENAGVTKQSEADEILRRVEPVCFPSNYPYPSMPEPWLTSS